MIVFAHDGVEEKMVAAESHAQALNIREQLNSMLVFLDQYGTMSWTGRDLTHAVLYGDSAEHSFGFSIHTKVDGEVSDKPVLVGGLIFHPGRTGTDRSFSVEVSPSSEPHWSIHT